MEFKSRLGKYKAKEVDAFIAQLKKSYEEKIEALQAQIAEQQTQCTQLKEKIASFEEKESVIAKVMLEATVHAKEIEEDYRQRAQESDMACQRLHDEWVTGMQSAAANLNKLRAEAKDMLAKIDEQFAGLCAWADNRLEALESAQLPSAKEDSLAEEIAKGAGMRIWGSFAVKWGSPGRKKKRTAVLWMTKNSKKTAALIGGVATVCLIALLSAVWYFSTRFAPSSTGEHIIANQLEEKISFVPYFKDGNIYMLQNGKTILAAENVYDPAAEDPIYTADYAIDAASGKMLYVAEGVLYLFTGEETLVLGSGVSSWRTVAGMDAVAFTTAMSGSSTLGILYLYYDGITVPLDTGVVSNTIRFSQNGQYLFAEKPNTYPQIRSRLICYETQTGTSVVADEDCAPVMWVSNSGSTVITGESFDDTLYSYRIFAQNFKKNKTFENVYYPSVTDDQSVAYLLCNYDLTAKSGDLVAVDLETLRSKKLAENVSFFNSDAVTDPSKGVVYSVCDSQEEGLYSIYYCDIQGRSTRLVRNTDEDTLYNVAINSEKHTGFLLAPGATLQDNAVYVLQWKNGQY